MLPIYYLKIASQVANASPVTSFMHNFVTPIMGSMAMFASLTCVGFLVNGGYRYMSSGSNPEKLAHAKRILRNALIGLAIVFGAAVLTSLLSHAYATATVVGMGNKAPVLTSIQPQKTGSGLTDVLIKAISGFLQNILDSVARPFMTALGYFTSGTPLMAANPSVFKLWLCLVAIADGLFVLVIGLLGFHVMSYATFGIEEIEIKHLLPRIGLIFLLVNSSIFLIDGIISLSNGMIRALDVAFPSTSVWSSLTAVTDQASGVSIAALLIMAVFVILAAILLVYYVGRLVTLYVGAVLSPIVFLLWLVPGFRYFVENAAKLYLSSIFILFIHVVILQLAASIFTGLIAASATHTPDTIMGLVVGLATITALLKTQGLMMQLSYASIGPRSARMLGGQFINSVSYLSSRLQGNNTYASLPRQSVSLQRPSASGNIHMSRGSATKANTQPKITASMLRVPGETGTVRSSLQKGSEI